MGLSTKISIFISCCLFVLVETMVTQYSLRLITRRTTYAFFRTRVCTTISITMFQIPIVRTQDFHEIQINQNSIAIFSDNLLKLNTSLPSVASCNEHVTFWLSWAEGLVEIGRGETLGEGRLNWWQQTQPVYNIKTIEFMSLGGKKDDQFEIIRPKGEVF